MLIPSNTTYATNNRDYRISEKETERETEAGEVITYEKMQSQDNKKKRKEKQIDV